MSTLLLSVIHKGKGCMIPLKMEQGLPFIYYRAQKVWSEIDVETYIFTYFAEDSSTGTVPFHLYDDVDVEAMYGYARVANKSILQLHLQRRDINDLSTRPTPQDNKLGRGKETAMNEIHGAEYESYDRLRWYCQAVEKYNPGSVAEYEIYPKSNKFRRVFICFGPCSEGFVRGCRPLIFLDKIYIKNKYKGILLSAIANDPNDDMFIIAYAVVDAENDDNWNWFCVKLRSVFDDCGIKSYGGFTFFTDRSASLIKALHNVFPDSYRSYCLRHVINYFEKQALLYYPKHNKQYWGAVFKRAVYATTYEEHKWHMSQIKSAMPLAALSYADFDPRCWANALFHGCRWGIIDNNHIECWSNWVLKARSLPLVSIIQHIQKQIMAMMSDRRKAAYSMTGMLCLEPDKRLTTRQKESRTLKLIMVNSGSYEVTHPDSNFTYVVDLGSLKCSCGVWQIERMPCLHACACIKSSGRSVYEFTDPYFNCDMYRVVYESTFASIPNCDEDDVMERDDDEKIHPLDTRVPSGRKRAKRIPL